MIRCFHRKTSVCTPLLHKVYHEGFRLGKLLTCLQDPLYTLRSNQEYYKYPVLRLTCLLPLTQVTIDVVNPKSITVGELYGQFNPLTMEWRDGVGSSLMRRAATDSKVICVHQTPCCGSQPVMRHYITSTEPIGRRHDLFISASENTFPPHVLCRHVLCRR